MNNDRSIEPRRIAEELHFSVSGPAWHGSALAELLAEVDVGTAEARPLGGSHTIHEIVLHLITWQELAAHAIADETIPEWPFPEDWPDARGRAWEQTIQHLLRSTQALVKAVNGMSDADLERIVPGQDFSFYFLLHGVSQHNAYHGGQIALLRKALDQARMS